MIDFTSLCQLFFRNTRHLTNKTIIHFLLTIQQSPHQSLGRIKITFGKNSFPFQHISVRLTSQPI